MTTFREFCASNQACEEGLYWLGDRTAEQFWRDCENPAWFLWVPLPELRMERIRCGYMAADLACRKYAPAALEAVGLHEQAAKLRALPEIVDVKTAEAATAAVAAWAEADADAALEAARAAADAAARAEVAAVAAAAWAERAASRASAVAAVAAAEAAWAAARAAWAAARAAMMVRFREIISLDQFLKACEAEGIE